MINDRKLIVQKYDNWWINNKLFLQLNHELSSNNVALISNDNYYDSLVHGTWEQEDLVEVVNHYTYDPEYAQDAYANGDDEKVDGVAPKIKYHNKTKTREISLHGTIYSVSVCYCNSWYY